MNLPELAKRFCYWAVYGLVALVLIVKMFPSITVDSMAARVADIEQSSVTDEQKAAARAAVQADTWAETPPWFWLLWSGALAAVLVWMGVHNEKGLATAWLMLFTWSWALYALHNHWLAGALSHLVLFVVPVGGLIWLLYGTGRIRQIGEGKMIDIYFFTKWKNTRVNSADAVGDDRLLQGTDFEAGRVRRGHLGWDIAFAIWPWRLVEWPVTLVRLDFRRAPVKTRGPKGTGGGYEALLVANSIVSFRWGPNHVKAFNRMATGFTTTADPDLGREEKTYERINPANNDGSLRDYLEEFLVAAIRHVVALGYTYGGKKDVNANIQKLREGVLDHLASAESPFAVLGILAQDGNGHAVAGASITHFELELEELLPFTDSELAKAIGAEAVADRRAGQRRTEGEADADVEAMKIERRAAAEAAATTKQIAAVKDAGVDASTAVQLWTAQEAARHGGTVVMVPGLAEAAGKIADAVKK